jgi:hypothetical protein
MVLTSLPFSVLEKIGKRFPAASGFAVEGVGLVGLGSLPLAEVMLPNFCFADLVAERGEMIWLESLLAAP